MHLSAHPVVLFAAELQARGFLAGVGKLLLFVIVILVLLGVFIGYKAAKRRG
jgi:hypothetical protein